MKEVLEQWPKNCRPVAQTSHLVELKYPILGKSMTCTIHGVRVGGSCLWQLLDDYYYYYNKITETWKENQNVDVVYPNFAKAFDECNHGVVAHNYEVNRYNG